MVWQVNKLLKTINFQVVDEDSPFSIERFLATVKGLTGKDIQAYSVLLASIREEELPFIQTILRLVPIPDEHKNSIADAAKLWKGNSHKRKRDASSGLRELSDPITNVKVSEKDEHILADLFRTSNESVILILGSSATEEEKVTRLLSLHYGRAVVPWGNEDAIEIKSYWKNDFVSQLLLSIGKLELPHIPVLKCYLPKSKYLKHDLPCSVRDNALDFTLLPGDLDNPNIASEVVQIVVSSIKSTVNQNFFHTNLLLGPSAVGKTKALFDIAMTFYTIFINGNYAEGGRLEMDIMIMMQNINKLTMQSHTRNKDIMEDGCKYEILLVSVSRVIALAYLLSIGAINSPTDWRNVQLNGLSTVDFDKFLSRIHIYLRREYSNTLQLEKLHDILCKAHLEQFKQPICIAIDEANVFIDTPKIFKSCTTFEDRPLWSLIGRTLSSFNSVALLIAGTAIGLSNREVLVSSIAKELGKQFYIRTEFRHMTTEDTVKFLRRIFIELPQDAHDLICSRLSGRMRYVTTVASRIEANPDMSPVIVVEKFITELQSDMSDWSIGFSLKKFYDKFSFPCIQYMQKILLAIYLNNGESNYEPEEIDWIVGGICRVIASPFKLHYKFDEPLVIECMEKFLDQRSLSVTDFLSNTMLDDSVVNPAGKGVLLDTIVHLTLMKNPYPAFITTILPSLPISVVTDFSVVHTSICTYLKNPSNKILAPSTRTGPDVIYFPDPSVMVLFSNCTTISSESVGGKKVRDLVETTNIANICSMKKDGTRVVDPKLENTIFNSLELISELLKNGLKHIFRVHIVLPGAPKTVTNDIFYPGHYSSYNHTINYNTPHKSDKKSISFREHTVSIDSSCLQHLKLFSAKTETNLLLLYPSKSTHSTYLN